MSKNKLSEAALREAALEKENLRLQRKIATLEARVISMKNELLVRPFPDLREGAEAVANFEEAWKKAKAAVETSKHNDPTA